MTTSVSHCPGEIPWFLVPRLGRLTPRRFEYGSPIRIGLTGQQLLLTAPEDVFHVLVGNATNYSKSRELTGSGVRQRVGGGLLGRQGSVHHERRRSLQPLFAQRSVEHLVRGIEQQCRQHLESWKDGESRDLSEEMGQLSRRILLASVFGTLNEDQIASLELAILWRRQHTERVYFSPLPRYGRWPTISRHRDREAQRVIAEHVRHGLNELAAGRPSGDLLKGMTTITFGDGQRLTADDIQDEVLSLMSTGHETITEWLTWCWVLLAQHPQFEMLWRCELERLGPLTDWLSKAPELAPATQGLLEESLRLYPPTWLFARVPLQDDRLPSGTMVRAGQNLLVCQYLMHRHPGTFPDPERFDPTRFQSTTTALHAGRTYFPFGAGPHRCIGDKLARLETLTVLVTIAREFAFNRRDSKPIVPHPGLTLGVRGGFRVRLHRLSSF
ncbi:MAG: cytochrome P450 [Planctomycetaceae bacterium]|jgi:cytochrome P450